MRILTRYILREFTRMLLVTLSAFVTLFLIGDFIEKVDDYVEHHAAVLDVAAFILYGLPNIVFLMTPVAVLLSTLLTLGMLSKNSEVIAMKASGIPLYRIAAPMFIVAVCLSAVIFWANETVIPYCNGKAEFTKTVKIEKRPPRPALKHDKLWFRGPKGEIVNIGLVEFVDDLPVCHGVTFYRLDGSFRLVERVDAALMEWVDGRWLLSNGTTYRFHEQGKIEIGSFVSEFVDLPERPDDFKMVERLSAEMNFSELKSYIERLRREGYNPLKYVVDMHGKVSFTLANIIMIIVAIPFSLKTSRSGGMAMGVGVCIVLAISYWLIYSFSMSLGHAGRFPPLFAAWLANMLFGATGLYLLLQKDR
ncbi:MAG: LPS export ABC transporter permease LptG [Nitrospirae bacterium]|nr:LPS export ABC transporter permease LptG [Nitrospirota bacterium]